MLVDLKKDELEYIVTALWKCRKSETKCEELYENMKEIYYTPSNQNLSAEDMIDDFIAECEKEAAKLEITVDYYLAEFV